MPKLRFHQEDNKYGQVCLNEKGDKVLAISNISEIVTVAKFTFDPKTKQMKSETVDFDTKNINGANISFHIIPSSLQDFIILMTKKQQKEVTVMLNDTIVTKLTANPTDLSFNVVDGLILNIYDVNASNFMNYAKKHNVFIYNAWDKTSSEKSEPYQVSHDIYNMQRVVNFPYVFFFYNHDQIYLRDLSKSPNDKKGFLYMNHYLGIDSKYNRPLTVHTYNTFNTTVINVPVVES